VIALVSSRSPGDPQLGHIERSRPASHPLAPREGGQAGALDQTALEIASTNLDLLFALQIYAREAQRDLGEAGIVQKHSAADSAREQMKKAAEKAREEAEKKAGWGGILSKLQTVAQVAAIVAAGASLVASGGMSAPVVLGLAGTLLSISAKPVGDAVGSEALEKGMFYGGVGLGAAGCAVGGLQLAAGCTQAASSGLQAGHVVAKVATLAGAGATTASGYASYRVGRHASLELDARADETEHRAKRNFAMRELDAVIEQLKAAEASFKRALTSLGKAQEQHAESALTLATLGGRS
jgi:hypothetical protein